MDVAAWLDAQGVGQYADSFAENHIDADTLEDLTADDLKDLGVRSVGPRKMLLAAIAKIRAGAPGLARGPRSPLHLKRISNPTDAIHTESASAM